MRRRCIICDGPDDGTPYTSSVVHLFSIVDDPWERKYYASKMKFVIPRYFVNMLWNSWFGSWDWPGDRLQRPSRKGIERLETPSASPANENSSLSQDWIVWALSRMPCIELFQTGHHLAVGELKSGVALVRRPLAKIRSTIHNDHTTRYLLIRHFWLQLTRDLR